MVNSFWFQTMIGLLLGSLSGLGVGGGSLLMLYLVQLLGCPQESARVLNLMFFLPSALVATLFRLRGRTFPLPLAGLAVAGGLAGAWAGTLLSGIISQEMLRKLLGVLFLLCGARELCYRRR